MDRLKTIEGRAELEAVYRDGLLDDVLPFWMQHGVDQDAGGVLTALDKDGTLVDSDKSVWAQGRFTWLLGKLTNIVGLNSLWLDTAIRTATFIEQHCFDPEDGRMWFHVDRFGLPIRKRRYAFSESFAAIAFGELFCATKSAKYLVLAEKCFQRFLNHDRLSSGFPPKFTPNRPTVGIGPHMIAIVTAQELRTSIGLAGADEIIDQHIKQIRDVFCNEELACVLETASPDGCVIEHFDGRTLNPGHAIEAAWFIMREGQLRNDSGYIQLGAKMLDWMWERGWDTEFGGMRYFVDLHGGPVQEYWHDMKFWWPHNEAIIATLLAYLLTGTHKYAQWHQRVHDWSYAHFADPEHGEWFGYLHRDGSLSSSLKGNLWKGPFHVPRMQLTCWQLLKDYREQHADSAATYNGVDDGQV